MPPVVISARVLRGPQRDFLGFRFRDVVDFCLLAAPLACVVFGVAPGDRIPTEAHCDQARGNFLK
jgi:hypothetical protein